MLMECFYASCPGQNLVSAGKVDMDIDEYIDFIKGRNLASELTTKVLITENIVSVNSIKFQTIKFSDRIYCTVEEAIKLIKELR